MAKEQKLSGWTWHKQHQEAMFRASYQHATGTYYLVHVRHPALPKARTQEKEP